MHFIAIFRVVE